MPSQLINNVYKHIYTLRVRESLSLSIFVPFIAGKYIVGTKFGKIKRFVKKINRFHSFLSILTF